jgi:hypothetical protein
LEELGTADDQSKQSLAEQSRAIGWAGFILLMAN